MNESVLFVDDEAKILQALARTMRPEGYEILTANSGEEALNLMNAKPVTVIVSDMRMPAMDGATLLKNVREEHPNTMRIVLTGYSDVEATVRAVNQGALFGYLSKPWDNQQLKQLVKTAVEAAQNKRKNRNAVASLKSEHNELIKRCFTQAQDMATVDWHLRDADEQMEGVFGRMEASLLDMLALRDPIQRGIVANVRRVVSKLSDRLEIQSHQKSLLETAARLYPIGRVGLPDRIIRRPFEKLEPHERSYVFLCAEHSAGLLKRFGPYRGVCNLISYQKAYLDGSGIYPREECEILLMANKILIAAIDYVEYRFGRMTGKAMTHSSAMAEMLVHSGRYDCAILEALRRIPIQIIRQKGLNEAVIYN